MSTENQVMERLAAARAAASRRHEEHVDAEPPTTIALRGPLLMTACWSQDCRDAASLWPAGTEFVDVISTVRGEAPLAREGEIAWWRLEGYDTFDGAPYPLEGVYGTEAAARAAARGRLVYLETTQPTAASGGQGELGIQDRVYVVRPDGTKYRFLA